MNIPTQASDDISRLAGQFNIYSQLLRNRIVMLWDQVDDEIAKEITAQLLYLEGEDPEKGYLVIYQLSRRFGNCWHGNLRYYAANKTGCVYFVPRSRSFHGAVPARSWGSRKAIFSQTCPHNDASATRRYSRSSIRHRNPSRAT